MRKLFTLAFCLFSLWASTQNTNTPIITKVTATWCPNCGNWGWDYFEDLKTIYGDGDEAILLGVHHSGDLRNDVSSWFAQNLNFSYQPQFYVNQTPLNVSSSNWQAKITEAQDLVQQIQGNMAEFELRFVNAYVDGDMIKTNFNVNQNGNSNGDYYLAVYIFENNVENSQSSRGMSLHPNVLRDIMAGDNYGESLTLNGSTGSYAMEKALNPAWNKDNIGLLAVVYEKQGNDYAPLSSQSILNVGLLSSDEEVFNDLEVNIHHANGMLNITPALTEAYALNVIGLNGQVIHSGVHNGAFNYRTTDLVDGLYAVQVIQDKKVLTKQVFIQN